MNNSNNDDLTNVEDNQTNFKQDKLEAYYSLGLKYIENTFEILGIKYIFKPVENKNKQKQYDIVTVIDMLKHAHDLVCFTEQFKDFLAIVYTRVRQHQT